MRKISRPSLKPLEAAFSTVFANFHKCRPQVAGDVISGMTVDQVGMDGLAKFGDSRSNISRIIQHFGQPNQFYAFCAAFNYSLQPSRTASDVISGKKHDKRIKFHDPRLNCSREIPSEAVGSGIFDRFLKLR